jgi:hypothetical protein
MFYHDAGHLKMVCFSHGGLAVTKLIAALCYKPKGRGLDSRCGEVFNLTHRQSYTPEEDSWYSFVLEAETTPET